MMVLKVILIPPIANFFKKHKGQLSDGINVGADQVQVHFCFTLPDMDQIPSQLSE